jgi:hypothetical protein
MPLKTSYGGTAGASGLEHIACVLFITRSSCGLLYSTVPQHLQTKNVALREQLQSFLTN